MNIAIVTGAAGGIGKACALLLIKQGYTVVGMGRISVLVNTIRNESGGGFRQRQCRNEFTLFQSM